MNGSVVPKIEKPRHDEIKQKVKNIQNIFYKGDELTSYEQDVERMYVADKLEKLNLYAKRKSLRYKVRWTISDLNKY
jgi:hypothetical protein